MVFGLFTRPRPATEWRDVTVGDKVYPVRVQQRSNARRLTMRVRDRAVHLTVPPKTPDSDIEGFVAGHSDWIDTQLQQLRDAIAEATPGIEGPAIFHEGEPKPVTLNRDPLHRGPGRIEETPEGLVIRVHAGSRVRPERVLENWLRSRAGEAITAELGRVLQQLGEESCPVSIRDQKTRWGSCSTTRRLSFNWRLIMAPPECLRYVVVHEASHLVHLDHSPQFWGLVAELMPDYRRHQQWLRQHQIALFADIGDRLAGLDPAPDSAPANRKPLP